jgi:Spy/CpxP family protein refolding chaperone
MNLRQEFQRQRHEQMQQARARVHALLTPEQQEKFDREFRPPPERDHDGGPGSHEGEGGPRGGDGPPP